MRREISTIKPEIEGKTKPKPDLEWNNKTIESIKENGFWDYEFPPSVNLQERNFLSQVDIRQGPIERQVTRIIRLKAIDLSLEKKERKEYIYYFENWYGKNWLGLKIAPVTDHIEGIYYEQLKQLRLDPKTGDALHYVKGKRRETYYIPFNKKTVDHIIAGHYSNKSVKYVHNKEDIKFVVKFASEDSPPGRGSEGRILI